MPIMAHIFNYACHRSWRVTHKHANDLPLVLSLSRRNVMLFIRGMCMPVVGNVPPHLDQPEGQDLVAQHVQLAMGEDAARRLCARGPLLRSGARLGRRLHGAHAAHCASSRQRLLLLLAWPLLGAILLVERRLSGRGCHCAWPLLRRRGPLLRVWLTLWHLYWPVPQHHRFSVQHSSHRV